MEQTTSTAAPIPTVSRVLADGRLIELVRSVEGRTLLALWDGTKTEFVEKIALSPAEHLVPVPATNSLIQHDAVVLPATAEPYGDVATLVEEILRYIDRYVVLSDWFRHLAAYYVLLTWVYDAFDELPYLRVQANWGSGKTRALLVIGSLCYRAFFASGASTVSPIFHTLHTFRGTLILDEADFRFSDQTAELSKILNNGNARGFPVFRTAITQKREFDPRAFQVFGPKIVAMRKSFEDEALESRFITERIDRQRMRPGIPINLPAQQRTEALELRNKLLQYRFEHRLSVCANESLADPELSPRTNQILIPLLSVVPDTTARDEIRVALRRLEKESAATRSTNIEADVLTILAELCGGSRDSIAVAEVAARLAQRAAGEYERPITNRYVGSVLRSGLGLQTYKTGGVYRVTVDRGRLSGLSARYGIDEHVRSES